MMVSMMKKRDGSFIVEMREDDDNERCCCLLLVVCCLLLFDLCQICVPLSMNVVGVDWIGLHGCAEVVDGMCR